MLRSRTVTRIHTKHISYTAKCVIWRVHARPPDVCVRFTYFVSLSIKGSQTLGLECVYKINLFMVRNNLRMFIMFQCTVCYLVVPFSVHLSLLILERCPY